MFLPQYVENLFPDLPATRSIAVRTGLALLFLVVVTTGGAFALRSYTVSRLPLWSSGEVTVLAILPDDLEKIGHRMADVLDLPEINTRLQESPGPYLVYFMPEDYVMQGMIADTGLQWKLYKRHHSLAMITDWIIHPFRHLEEGCSMAQGNMGQRMDNHCGDAVSRMIFLRVETEHGESGPSGVFGINVRRVPLFMADVDIHNLALKDVKDLPAETGWGRVPTPAF